MVISQCLVACNVYVSAGGKHGTNDLLLKLAKQTQLHCSQLALNSNIDNTTTTTSNNNYNNNQKEPIALVHAYSDGPYDRSSFHIAGSTRNVAIIASSLATSAIDELIKYKANTKTKIKNDDSLSPHPTVGLVDHISIVPLQPLPNDNKDQHNTFTLQDIQPHFEQLSSSSTSTSVWATMESSLLTDNNNNNNNISNSFKTTCSGWVARWIGSTIQQQYSKNNYNNYQKVLYYGHANLHGTPLATIRRESTNFFNSTFDKSPNDVIINSPSGQTITIGAPPQFVENYNIRLTNTCTGAMARSLTKHLRERNGGLPHIEALTLPYSNQRWEVACNLLDPIHSSTVNDIENRLKTWKYYYDDNGNYKTYNNDDDNDDKSSSLIEVGYRVGTTVTQCLDAIEKTSTTNGRKEFDRNVLDHLYRYLNNKE